VGDLILLGDVHLSPEGGESTRRFVDFLDGIGENVGRVVLLGDVFDLWVGPETAHVEAYREPIRAMRSLTDRGVRLTLVWGNRDFLMDETFADSVGAELAGETWTVDAGGTHVHATHGDGFLENDRGYQVLRFVLRNPLGRLVARRLPFGWAWGIGMALRRSSVRSTARKQPRAFEVSNRALERLVAGGTDLVVCGHVHRHERRVVRAGGREGTFLSLEAFGETRAFLRLRQGSVTLENA